MIQFKFDKQPWERSVGSNLSNVISKSLINWYSIVQLKWATWMGKAAGRLTRKKLYVVLVLFVLLTGSYSTLLIVQGVAGKAGRTFKIVGVMPVKGVNRTLPFPKANTILSDKEYQKIIRFRKYIDSLGRSPTGRPAYDSLVKARPGLFDSLAAVEKYYKSNLKN